MTTTAESSDWIQWYFVVQDTAKNNEVWEYIDPSTKKDALPKLETPKRPTPADVRTTSTSVAYLPLIEGLDTVYERLQALKNALAPTTSGRKHDVLIQYTALKSYDTTQSMDKWLNSWRNIYKLAEQLELPDVQGFRPHYDFVRAIKPISSSFAGALEVDLIRQERKDKPVL